MSGNTPGPWIARRDPDGSPSDYCICMATDEARIDRVATCYAWDAHLIAAAPELLAALKDLDEAYCDMHPDMTREARNFGRKALIAARAAIAKATLTTTPESN